MTNQPKAGVNLLPPVDTRILIFFFCELPFNGYECSLQDRIEGQRLLVEMWIARTTLWPRLPFYSATIDISLHEEGQIKMKDDQFNK